GWRGRGGGLRGYLGQREHPGPRAPRSHRYRDRLQRFHQFPSDRAVRRNGPAVGVRRCQRAARGPAAGIHSGVSEHAPATHERDRAVRSVLQPRRHPPQRGDAQGHSQRSDPDDQRVLRHVASGDSLTRTEPAPWGSEHGIRSSADAVLLMRLLRLLLLLVAAASATSALAAQAVERTDIPRRGTLRVTLDPRIVTWDRQYVNGTAWRPLGAPLTGDSVG